MGGKSRKERAAKRQRQEKVVAETKPVTACSYGAHDMTYAGPVLSKKVHFHVCARCGAAYTSDGLDPCEGCRVLPKPPSAKDLGWRPYREPQIKISYWRVSGYEAKAYVSERPDENGLHYGINKHTDEKVIVRWDEKLNRWEEVTE